MNSARLASLLCALALAGACGGAGGSTTSAPTAAAASPRLYVSIGDSYAAGYQPTSHGHGSTTRNGFAYQLVTKARKAGHDFELVNFGCGGATTASILRTPGCRQPAPDGHAYAGESQGAAALRYVTDHRDAIGLVTVSVGGNDVTSCATEPDPMGCVTAAVDGIKANLTPFLRELRAAAGANVRIVGITYPDVVLGAWVTGLPFARALAPLSVTAFRTLINPALAEAYGAVGGTFVDVTAASGAYGSFSETTKLAPYGVLPVPVARVCELTFFCQYQDIHPTNAGYALIADLVLEAL